MTGTQLGSSWQSELLAIVGPRGFVTGEDAAADETGARYIRDQLYRLVVEDFGGSFSAEHGVGPHNVDYYDRYTSKLQKNLAGGIQKLLDPLRLCGAVDFRPGSTTAGEVFHR